MAFTGPYPTKFTGKTSAMVISATTFSGGVTNAGTIGAGGVSIIGSTFLTGGFLNTKLISATSFGVAGIGVLTDGTIQGAIVDSGTIIAKDGRGILVSGGVVSGGIHVASHGAISAFASAITVVTTARFGGGITNSGTLSAGFAGIIVESATTFSGGITNSGKITSKSRSGIFVSNVAVFGTGSAGGSIINSGTLSANNTAIELKGTTTFAGGISNTGTIASTVGDGIFVSNVAVFGTAGIAGGIANTGTIRAADTGIELYAVSIFAGDITNSGKIASTAFDGIFVSSAAVFGTTSAGGGIANSGTISAGHTGLFINDVATVLGGVVNSGTISAATGNGIFVSNVTVFGDGGYDGLLLIESNVANSALISPHNAGFLAGAVTIIGPQPFGNASGGITNSGKITAGLTGIDVRQVATFYGGISNTGSISAAGDSFGIGVKSAGAFDGGITNGGAISAGTGIGVEGTTTTFAGGISNSGKITGARNGILVQSGSVFGSTSAGGGISNSGVISGKTNGVLVNNITSFAGGIGNSGTISGGNDVFVENVTSFSSGVSNRGTLVAGSGGSGIGFFQDNVLSGGVTNAGTIRALSTGIALYAVSTFTGDITNSKGGTISVGQIGIRIGAQGNPVSSFTGNIVNSGAIAAKTGISISDSTIIGAIVDSGTIMATSHGILIDSASRILAGNTATAIAIAGPTFTGGITNFGMISGSAGIEIKTVHPVSIFDAGAIIGTGGTAIEFAGSGNTLTLGAGYVISGIVDPSGNNTLQLGGTGSASFDFSSIGSAAQYRGFTSFDVVGGTWTVTGASTAHWTIEGGTLRVANGGEVASTTVSGGGTLDVESGGTAGSTFVKSGATDIVESGAAVSGVTVSRGGTLELVGGAGFPGGLKLSAGAIVGVGSGELFAGQTVSNGITFKVLSGGTDRNATVSAGGTLIVAFGGSDSGSTILKGGVEIVSAGGKATDTNVSNGGALVVSSGGVADPTTIFSGGTETISAHGTDSGAHVLAGGKLFVRSGGTAVDVTIFSGGTAINSVGGRFDAVGRATDLGTLVNSGAVNVGDGGALVLNALTVSNPGTINLSGASGGSGAEIYVSGSVALTGGGKVVLSPSGNNTIEAGGITNTLINVNNTILGAGTVGGVDLKLRNSGTIAATASALIISSLVINAGTLAATSGGILRIAAGGTNSKTIVASAGGVVNITSSTIVNGAGGVILASGSGAQVDLDGATISGGTLKTSGASAVIETISSGGGGVLDGLASSVTNLGTVLVNDDSALTLRGTIKNSGTIFVDNVDPAADVHLFIDTAGVTLQGGGTVQLSNEFCNFITGVSSVTRSVLLNVDNTISGQGVIGSSSADNEAGLLQLINGAKGEINGNGTFFIPLTIATPGSVVINSGTLEGTNSVGLAIESDVANSKIVGAFGSGALLTIRNEAVISNTTAGVVVASGNGAEVDLSDATIAGGTLKTSGTGALIETLFATDNTISGVTIAGGSLVKVNAGSTLTISGTINNSGAIEIEPPVAVSGTLLVGSSSATLQGGGTVIMGGSDAFIRAVSSGATLVNVKNTISGAGTIGAGDGHLTLVNSSTVNANSAGGTLTISTGNTVTNAGTLEATSSGSLVIADGINNAKIIEALGSGARVTIDNGSIIRNTTASALVVASGKGAQVELDGATVSGGIVEAMSGSTAIMSGGTIAATTTVETLNGGTAIVKGVVTNSGTLMASGIGSLLEITGGTVVSGGAVKVVNGIVDVLSGGTANVIFQSNGSGGLKIADTSASTSAFTGTVSGFGGVNHTNRKQFIDLVSVTSDSTVSAIYATTGANSGVLTVTSGGLHATVAAIGFIGHYVTSNFHVTAGTGGSVAITDPTVPIGGSADPGANQAFPRHGIDLPDIAFGAHTTLAYSDNGAGTGGMLTVGDGRHAATIALLGNYMAGSFVATPDGHGGTLVTEAQTQPPLLLSHPRA